MTVAAKMFGTVKKVDSKEVHVPDRAMLERGLEIEGAVSQVFCNKCDTYWEIRLKRARTLAKTAGVSLKGVCPGSHFFIVSGCEECGEGEVVSFMKISDLPKPIMTNK